MPPKRDARKDQVGDGGNGPGSRTVDVVMPQNAGNGGSGIAGTGFGPALDGNGGAVPPNPGAAPAPGDHSSASSSSAGGAPPMEVDLTQESIKDKVSHGAKAFENLFYEYGNQLTQATQEVLARAKGVDAQSAKEISASWGKVRKQMQPKLNLCLLEVVESVPDEFEPEQAKETAHPGVRPVAFRDLVENARADIVESLEELVKWVVTNAQDPATLQSLAGLKQEAHTQVYDTVLSKMSRDILDRMADIGSSQVDFGRDSDYGQALQAQQNLAKEKDDLQLQLEGFQKQVDDLKASEADLYAKCTELQEKFTNAQADLWVSKDKVDILDAVTKFLGTDDANVVSDLVAKTNQHASVVATVSKLEDKDDARIKDLETQLRAAKDANVNLQRIVADQQKQITSGSGGAQQSLVERAREIGFIIDPSGNLQLGPPPRQSLRHLTALLLHQQSVPPPPPLKVFLGEYKEDKMGLSEFLKMYKHRYGSCAEDTKVDMLGEYLAGEAKRVYKSILSSWDGRSSITFDELESGMKNLMLDNSRTGMLLKQQRVHGLRMKEDESYLSFITFLETKVCEAYGDESYSIVDGVKIQVLLRNIRDPTLALQVEQALRSVPMGSPLFPTAKDLVIAYERTAKQARQWTGNPGSVFNRSHGKVSGRSKFQGNSSNQEKPDSKSAGTDGGAPSPTSGSGGSDSPRSIPVCFNCHKPGHRKAECRSGGTPHLTGGNAAPAKFGNRGPIVCHECGEPGHTRPNCPKRSRGNFTRSNGTAQSGNASAAVEKPTIAESDSFLSMNMSQGVRDLVKGVVGGQCVAPVWLNGIESKALWDTGSQVDIISKAHLQDILRKSPERLRKAKCLTVHPPGVSIKDASGKEMPFLGLVQLEIKAQATDPAEMHKFLVQDGPTNFDVVLGTPTLFGSTLFCDQLIQLMKGWNATSRPRAGKDASSNGYCMRIAVESNEWSEVTVTRSCYVRPGSEKTVRLSCGLKDATALLVGDGVSFCDVDADGHLRATVVNSGNNTLCLMKGTKVAECVDAAKVSLEEVEQLAADAGHAMLTRTDGEVAKRASEIYERVLEGSQGKSVLSENKDKVLLLFERFNDCFALSDFELGTTHLFEHEIELAAGTKPIAQPGRPVPLALRKPLKEMLEQYRQMGVIKPSRSDWSSPVVLVRKKDGSIRMCVDYRRLNKVIKLSQYPMPNINVMLQSLVGKKFFTTCDLHSGYWQIPLSPKAKELTAFSTLGGHWEFNVLPFGLSNAPGGFERAMETIFDEELG
ncbi:gagpol and env protein precursor, partial [Aphelenchoides avenae]